MEYEAVIGLEVHVQLKTKSKMFTDTVQGFGHEPNELTNPVIMGLPGTLPVLNKSAIEQSVKLGIIFDSETPEVIKWDRKNYFYPDSPKNYQLTQFDQPVCVGGTVEIELPGKSRNVMGEHKTVELTRAHLEEDVGKLTHFERDSLVDYNRAGTPLLEIVTEPVIKSSEEAVAFLNSLRMHLTAAGISDCDMEKGQMRCDANVSIRPKGSTELNPRTEMKNLNSVSGVKNGIDYEIKRQTKIYEKGGIVDQETRRWDADSNRTTSMRSKEDAHDYRYFPDPDLMPVRFPRSRIEELRAELPEKVFDQQRRYQKDYALPYTLTSVICFDYTLSNFFEGAIGHYNKNPKATANYIANDLQRERAASSKEGLLPMEEVRMTPKALAELVQVIDAGKITKQIAKDVFTEMFETGKSASEIIKDKELEVKEDLGTLEKICREAIATNDKAVSQVKNGDEKALNTFMGPVMKATQGKANPQKIREILKKLILEN